jgi:DNA-binding NarL/FixJ family response regulator
MLETADEIRILIADDHPIFRAGLRQVIEAESDLSVVADANDGRAALELIQQLHPDIAILDIHMPLMSGFELAKSVRKLALPLEIVFLTMHKAEDIFNEAMDVGAKGYVLKESAVNDIVASIRAVAGGLSYISPLLSTFLLSRRDASAAAPETTAKLGLLTATERKVLGMLAQYKTSKQIAEELFIHPRTVDNHRANICNKLGLHGSHALLKFAVQYANGTGK